MSSPERIKIKFVCGDFYVFIYLKKIKLLNEQKNQAKKKSTIYRTMFEIIEQSSTFTGIERSRKSDSPLNRDNLRLVYVSKHLGVLRTMNK